MLKISRARLIDQRLNIIHFPLAEINRICVCVIVPGEGGNEKHKLRCSGALQKHTNPEKKHLIPLEQHLVTAKRKRSLYWKKPLVQDGLCM